MKKLLIICILMLSIFNLYAQGKRPSYDIGLFAGGSYYIGEINLGNQRFSVKPNYGGMFRKNYNTRFSTSYRVYYAKIISNDADSKYMYQNMRNSSFSSTLIDATFQAEFNFLQYKIGDVKKDFSPYTFTGVSLYKTHEIDFAIPFGIGFKWNFDKRIGIEFEWGFRKTFSDKIDNMIGEKIPSSPVQLTGYDLNKKQTAYFHSKDWYSFVGITLVCKIFDEPEKCKAYYN